MTAPVTRAKVEAALRAEAKKLDAKHRGAHSFTPIWQCDEALGCNWSANYRASGSSVPLSDMRAALERVQAKMPRVSF